MKKMINSALVSLCLVCLSSCEDGEDGKKSLINVNEEPSGSNCVSGGFRIDTGIDRNNNNILDDNEIQVTKYICNGRNGLSSLLKVSNEEPSNNCQAGGMKIVSGTDLNDNNVLDDAEIQNTIYVCSGIGGLNSLVDTSVEDAGQNCKAGGYKIVFGVDLNKNNSLDQNEIQDTRFVCNGEEPTLYKETRIMFPGQGSPFTSFNVDGSISPLIHTFDFNLANYPGADSIVFTSLLRSGPNNTATAELYDITHGQVIPNSQISATSADWWLWVKTQTNVLDEMPVGNFTLGIRIKTGVQGVEASFFQPILIIYRK